MAKCSNCSKTMSCGCQRRTASDGKAVCSSCLSLYEKSLKPAAKSINRTSNSVEGGFVLSREQNKAKNLQKFMKT